MSSDLPKGYIQTVCGPLDPTKLGTTLCHEHLFHDLRSEVFHPRKPLSPHEYLNHEPVTADGQWWTNFHPYSHTDNINFIPNNDFNTIIKDEMLFYKSNGGTSLVEVTTFGKHLGEMRNTSISTGVNIIAGAGYYVAHTFGSSIIDMSIEELYNNIKMDLLVGSDGVKCGIIGEIGSEYPIRPFEKRVLMASGQLQEELKVPVLIHPGRDPKAPFEALRIFLESGGRPEKTVMSHLDRTLFKDEDFLEFASLGAINAFDLFGIECSYYEVNDYVDMPNDATRIAKIKMLIDEGFSSNIVVSHDIHTRHRLMKFGGHGFSHILMNVVPKMKMRGIKEENIIDILVNTPRNWLTL